MVRHRAGAFAVDLARRRMKTLYSSAYQPGSPIIAQQTPRQAGDLSRRRGYATESRQRPCWFDRGSYLGLVIKVCECPFPTNSTDPAKLLGMRSTASGFYEMRQQSYRIPEKWLSIERAVSVFRWVRSMHTRPADSLRTRCIHFARQAWHGQYLRAPLYDVLLTHASTLVKVEESSRQAELCTVQGPSNMV